MKDLRLQTSFKRDYKRIAKRRYDLVKLEVVTELLRSDLPLPAARKDHSLTGNWIGWRECHIESDWLLIYKTTDDEVLLARTGTHSDLFQK